MRNALTSPGDQSETDLGKLLGPVEPSPIVFNDEDERADRVGLRVEDDGKKVRFFKSNGKAIEG